NFATEVKYLGVMLDSKLHWGRHLQLKTEKACRAFWQCRGAIGVTWGLTPRTVIWLYVAVIRPMLTYGAIVWWPRTKLETAKKHLNHVQRLACLAITGAIRTTPTFALETALSLTPLDILREEAVRAAIRLKTTGEWMQGVGPLDTKGGRPLLEAPVDRR